MEPGFVIRSAMFYAFGAAAAGATPPPAGAAPAAFSNATLTEWPLKERVGANSPSLCPIICSVTYTGINFLPLCTAIVCPIMSGTMVERRDHVFTTFFSFRAFRPSSLSRRWPSTNGPFFNERAIGSLFLHAAQTAPLGMPHLFKTTHRSRHSVRFRTERTDKSRAQRVRRTIHNDRPAGLAQLVQHRLEWYHYLRRRFDSGLRHCPFYRSLHRARPASRSACSTCPCRSHVSALPSQFCNRQPGSAFRASFTLGALVQDYAPSSVATSCFVFFQLQTKTGLLLILTCGAAQSCVPYACCAVSSCPGSGKPRAFADDCPSLCLPHHRGGDPRGSWPRHEPSVSCRANACGRPCRRFRFRDRDCQPGRRSPCNPEKICELPRKAS